MKVTAIMPTRDRRAFIPLAIASLLSQDWLRTGNQIELLIVDDGNEPVDGLVRELLEKGESAQAERCRAPRQRFDLGETHGIGVWLNYVRMCGPLLEERERTIGGKRNLACEMAAGEIIIHWDDDDWSASTRISEQIKLLEEHAVTGYHDMLFWEESRQRASVYTNGSHYALGSSLCYTRSWWKDHKFPSYNIGEDNHFVNAANEAGKLLTIAGRGVMVARVHPGNTSKNKSNFPKVSSEDVPTKFFEQLKSVACASTSSVI